MISHPHTLQGPTALSQETRKRGAPGHKARLGDSIGEEKEQVPKASLRRAFMSLTAQGNKGYYCHIMWSRTLVGCPAWIQPEKTDKQSLKCSSSRVNGSSPTTAPNTKSYQKWSLLVQNRAVGLCFLGLCNTAEMSCSTGLLCPHGEGLPRTRSVRSW